MTNNDFSIIYWLINILMTARAIGYIAETEDKLTEKGFICIMLAFAGWWVFP